MIKILLWWCLLFLLICTSLEETYFREHRCGDRTELTYH